MVPKLGSAPKWYGKIESDAHTDDGIFLIIVFQNIKILSAYEVIKRYGL
jgi:hypothetical protein